LIKHNEAGSALISPENEGVLLTPVAALPVGVGPWVGEWPSDGHFDPELLVGGDTRNVPDEFRYWTVAAIRAELARRRVAGPKLWIGIENWHHDFNIGSIVRTANAFNVAGVFIVGKKRWNKRGAMVTDRYLDVLHCETVADFKQCCESLSQFEAISQDDSVAAAQTPAAGETPIPSQIPIIGIDNIPGSIPIETYQFPRDCVLVFGQESTGLTPEMQAVCGDILHITQYGSTRSINAGAAGAIAMFEWSRQTRTP